MVKKKIDIAHIKEKMQDLINCLTPQQEARLEQEISLHTLQKNEVMFRENSETNDIFCLIEGKIKEYKEGIGGRSQTIRLIKPVQYFGFSDYFVHKHYTSSATTLEMCQVVRIPMAFLSSLIQENNKLALFFIHTLAKALIQADKRTLSLTQKHIRARLAEALLFLKECYGLEEDGCTLSIYMSREDLGNLSNMTTSNAIRTLSAFAAEKLIIVDGRKIKLVREKELEHISKMG